MTIAKDWSARKAFRFTFFRVRRSKTKSPSNNAELVLINLSNNASYCITGGRNERQQNCSSRLKREVNQNIFFCRFFFGFYFPQCVQKWMRDGRRIWKSVIPKRTHVRTIFWSFKYFNRNKLEAFVVVSSAVAWSVLIATPGYLRWVAFDSNGVVIRIHHCSIRAITSLSLSFSGSNSFSSLYVLWHDSLFSLYYTTQIVLL